MPQTRPGDEARTGQPVPYRLDPSHVSARSDQGLRGIGHPAFPFWLHTHYAQLTARYSKTTFPNGLLLTASRPMEEQQLLFAIAQWMLCMNPQREVACLSCASCHLIAANTHPDWSRIHQPLEEPIGLELLQIALAPLESTPHQAQHRIISLYPSENLTEAAMNSLLKVVEEPPVQTHFILLSHEPHRLLPTLRSRLQTHVISAPQEAVVQRWLTERMEMMLLAERPSSAQILSAIRLASCSPPLAQKLLEPALVHRRTALVERVLQALQQQEFLILLPILDQPDALTSLRWYATLWLDSYKLYWARDSELTLVDLRPALQRLSDLLRAQQKPHRLPSLWQKTLQCLEALTLHAGLNQTLLVTHLLCVQQSLLYKV